MRESDRSRDDYTIGIVCALGTERTAVEAVLDSIHTILPSSNGDRSLYLLGTIGRFNVVVACLPAGYLGKVEAATLAGYLAESYKRLQLVLMVGIGGGVPSAGIRLGDVVVSVPTDGHPGLVEWDLGKEESTFRRVGVHRPPSRLALNGVQSLRTRYDFGQVNLLRRIQEAASTHDGLDSRYWAPPDLNSDILFESGYKHQHGADCRFCDPSLVIGRPVREDPNNPRIFYGNIASGDKVMKDAIQRDEVARRDSILCFEMEAAGLAPRFEYLVIRGICDYADSHKHKDWQPWAAMTAAAYAKELLEVLQDIMLPEDGARSFTREGDFRDFSPLTSKVASWALFDKTETIDQHTVGKITNNLIGEGIKPTRYMPSEDECLISLSYNGLKDREKAIASPIGDTCEWLFSNATYQRWQSTAGLLWLKGKPGAGKSTITSHLVKRLQARACQAQGESLVVSHFFYAGGSKLQKSLLGFYRSLLHQLVRKDTALSQEFAQHCAEKCANEEKPMPLFEWHQNDLQTEFIALLAKATSRYRVFIVVDALDECEDEPSGRTIQSLLADLCSSPSKKCPLLSVCISCRPFPAVMKLYDYEIAVDACNGEDINTAITAQLGPQALSFSPVIEQSIREKASGVFQWVLLVVERIIEMDNDGEGSRAMLREITNTPLELRDIYEDLLRKTTRKDAGDALHLMQWVSFAARPLTLNELRIALVMDESCSAGRSVMECIELNEGCEDVLQMEKRVRALSKGLLEVKTLADTRLVQFIHQSAREYVVGDGLTQLYDMQRAWRAPHEDHKISANDRLAKSCVRYLLVEEILAVGIEDLDLAPRLESLPFCEYAAKSWTWHVRASDHPAISPRYLVEACQWPSAEILQGWARIYNASSDIRMRDESKEANDLLFVAISEDLNQVLRYLLDTQSGKGRMHEFGPTLVERAAFLGKSKALKMLLEHGFSATTPTNWGVTPLHRAVRTSSLETVRMLLDAGADVNQQDDLEKRTPLHEAAKSGHPPVMQLLLSHNVNINATDLKGQTPLHVAVQLTDANADNVNLLLEAGAQADLPDETGTTPLLLAVAKSSAEIIRLLIKKSADINARPDDGLSPLAIAAHGGRTAILEALISAGADVNLPCQGGLTALMIAVAAGHDDAVRTLLLAGADTQIPDASGNSPLQQAARFGTLQMVRDFVLAGANPFWTNDKGETVVHVALRNGRLDVASWLVQQALHEDVPDDEGYTPFLLAAGIGKVVLLKLLIFSGVAEDVRGFDGRRALHVAAYHGRLEAVKFLLERGGDGGVRDEGGKTPFELAKENGHLDVAELLSGQQILEYEEQEASIKSTTMQ